jgi:hypothetical protein
MRQAATHRGVPRHVPADLSTWQLWPCSDHAAPSARPPHSAKCSPATLHTAWLFPSAAGACPRKFSGGTCRFSPAAYLAILLYFNPADFPPTPLFSPTPARRCRPRMGCSGHMKRDTSAAKFGYQYT